MVYLSYLQFYVSESYGKRLPAINPIVFKNAN